MMLKKSIIVYVLIVGFGSMHAAAYDYDIDFKGSQNIAPHLGTFERDQRNNGAPQQFWVYGDGEFMDAHDQLLCIIDGTKDAGFDNRIGILETSLKWLPKLHAYTDLETIFKTAVVSVDNALLVLINSKRIIMSYKGLASKALLIMREGAPVNITEDACAEPTVKRLAYTSACKGVVFMRGMSRTDEEINATVQTALSQEKKTPRDVAKALVDAEEMGSMAAAFLDYDILHAEKVAARRKPLKLQPIPPYRPKKKQ